MPQSSTTLCKLDRGAFRVTAQPVCRQGVNSFDVTVTDMDVEVTVNYPLLWFGFKRRLGVQDLGWAFYSIMSKANAGAWPPLEEYHAMMQNGRMGKDIILHAENKRIRSKVMQMDISSDDLPDIMAELRVKYDLMEYDTQKIYELMDAARISDRVDSFQYAIGVDVGFPGSDHAVCTIQNGDVKRITKRFTEVTENG